MCSGRGERMMQTSHCNAYELGGVRLPKRNGLCDNSISPCEECQCEGSNAIDSADQDQADVRPNYGDVDIAGPRRLRKPLVGGTSDVKPREVRIDQMKIQKQAINKATVTSSSPAAFGHEIKRMTVQRQSSWAERQRKFSRPSRRTWTSEPG